MAIRLAVIGCGGRGRHHLERLVQFEDVEIVAIADASSAARDAVGEEYSVAARYDGITPLLDAVEVDAVVLATPAHLNAATAAVSLERGIDTLMEKPPGLSVEETRHLRDLAAGSGARAMVAWDRRFNPWITQARAVVAEHGPMLQLVGEFTKPTQTIHDPRFPEQLRDNMLLESPIHTIDVVRAMAGGDVAEVHSVVRRATSGYKDIHAALVRFDNDCVAQLSHNYTAAPIAAAETDAATAQARYFLDCERDDEPIQLPAADLNEAVKTMELCTAILDGLRT